MKGGQTDAGRFCHSTTGFAGVIVDSIRREGDTLFVSVYYRGMSRRCLACGLASGHVHQYRWQYKSHRPLWARALTLEIRKRS
jgi:hypothetical protein